MKMHIPLGKPQPWVLTLTVACLALGALIGLLLLSTTEEQIDPTKMSRETLATLYRNAQKENTEKEKEITNLRATRDELMNSISNDFKLKEAWQREINELRVRAGATPVEGPGIVITIDDTTALRPRPSTADINANAMLTHDVDLLQLVNELRSANAEAIAINDQRVAGSSPIRCVGPAINVNTHPVSPPFIIKAIGKPDTLHGAANLPYGVLDQLRQLDIKVTVEKRQKIRVPAVTLPPLEVGHVVPEKENAK